MADVGLTRWVGVVSISKERMKSREPTRWLLWDALGKDMPVIYARGARMVPSMTQWPLIPSEPEWRVRQGSKHPRAV